MVCVISLPPSPQDKDLPPGWEVRKAKDGRTYYVDHNTHRTVWEHPMETSQRLAKEDELGPLPVTTCTCSLGHFID